jgi:hypothetical protein
MSITIAVSPTAAFVLFLLLTGLVITSSTSFTGLQVYGTKDKDAQTGGGETLELCTNTITSTDDDQITIKIEYLTK